MNCGIIGNTRLTLYALEELLSRGHNVLYVFGLPDKKLKNKVSSASMLPVCDQNNIDYINSGDWQDIQNIDVDIVFEFGDSRIIPKSFLDRNEVIGNHGALLPRVQGAASLVWGRMLNNGSWGVTLFKVSEKIDSGDIVKAKEFSYDTGIGMNEFVDMCDKMTIECLQDYLDGDYSVISNQPWDIKVPKGEDSRVVVDLMKDSLDAGKNIYLPPRNPASAKINKCWTSKFMHSFKLANDNPYPEWYYGDE